AHKRWRRSRSCIRLRLTCGRVRPLQERIETFRLPLQFLNQGCVKRPAASIIRIAEQSARTVTVVFPTRVVSHWIETDTLHRDAVMYGGFNLVADISQPADT